MHLPLVSLLLPIRNESATIERCLNAILAQDYPGGMEILIADGLSTDDTREKIRSLTNSVHGLRSTVTILDNPGKIVPTGMNIALRQAKGEIIIRVDGHCIIAPDYVCKCVEHIQNDGVDGVGGPMESIGETLISKVIAMGMSSPFGVGNSAFRTLSGKSMLVDTVPFPAYTRQIIQRAGYYDEELVRNQDDEYNYRIRELGGKILLAEDVRSTYFSRSSLKHLWRQYYQYGFWKVRVLQKHPRQMSPRQFVPPVFVLGLIASTLLALASILLSPLTAHWPLNTDYGLLNTENWSLFTLHLSSFIPLAYILSNLTASLWTAFRSPSTVSRLRSLVILPIVFAILHLSYGFGFLAGLVKFWNRWGDKVGKTPGYGDSKVLESV